MDKTKFTSNPQLDAEGFMLHRFTGEREIDTRFTPEGVLRPWDAQEALTGVPSNPDWVAMAERQREATTTAVNTWAQLPDDIVEQGHAAWLRSGGSR